mgnify:CR=1 FL=1
MLRSVLGWELCIGDSIGGCAPKNIGAVDPYGQGVPAAVLASPQPCSSTPAGLAPHAVSAVQGLWTNASVPKLARASYVPDPAGLPLSLIRS